MRLKMVILALLAHPLSAQIFLFTEHYTMVERDNGQSVTTPTVDLWVQRGLRNKIGLFAWAQATPTWSQSYGGVSYQLTNWLQAGAGGGMEQADPRGRFASFVFVEKDRNLVFGVYENGGSGRWHLAYYNHRVGNGRFGVGALTQAFVGSGPRAEVNFGPLKVWGAPLLEVSGGYNFMFGVRYIYFREKK